METDPLISYLSPVVDPPRMSALAMDRERAQSGRRFGKVAEPTETQGARKREGECGTDYHDEGPTAGATLLLIRVHLRGLRNRYNQPGMTVQRRRRLFHTRTATHVNHSLEI